MKQKLKELGNDIEEFALMQFRHRQSTRDIIGDRMISLIGAVRAIVKEPRVWESRDDAVGEIEHELHNAMADIFHALHELKEFPNLDAAGTRCITGIGELVDGDFVIHDKANAEIRKKVWDLTGGHCVYCDVQLVDGGTGANSFVVEHVVPRSSGGPDRFENYVPACSSCNIHKSNGHVLNMSGDRRSTAALRLVRSSQENGE